MGVISELHEFSHGATRWWNVAERCEYVRYMEVLACSRASPWLLHANLNSDDARSCLGKDRPYHDFDGRT